MHSLKLYMIIKATHFLKRCYHFRIIHNIAFKTARLAANWLKHRCLLHKQSGIGLWCELNANIQDHGKMKHKRYWNSNTDFLPPFDHSLAKKLLWAVTDNICEATGCFQSGQHLEITGKSSFLLFMGQRFHFLWGCTALLFYDPFYMQLPSFKFSPWSASHAFLLRADAISFLTYIWGWGFHKNYIVEKAVGIKCLSILRAQSEWKGPVRGTWLPIQRLIGQ